MSTNILKFLLSIVLSILSVHSYADCMLTSFKDNYVANNNKENIFFIKGIAGDVSEHGRTIEVIEDLKGNFTGETSIFVWGGGNPGKGCMTIERLDVITRYQENDTLIMLIQPVGFEECFETYGTYTTIDCAYSILTMEDDFVTGYIDPRHDAWTTATMSWEDLQTLLSNPINTHCFETSFKENYVNNYEKDDVVFIKAVVSNVFVCDFRVKIIEDLKGNYNGETSILVWGGNNLGNDCKNGDRLDILSQYQENDTVIMLIEVSTVMDVLTDYATIPCAFSVLKLSHGVLHGRILPTFEELQYPEEIPMTWKEFEEIVLNPTTTTIQPITGKHAVYQQNGTIFFENTENRVVKLSFYDLSGKLVHEAVTTAHNYRPVLAGNTFVCAIQINNELQTITYIAP